MNFFKGFEYEPGVDWEAMMALDFKERDELKRNEGEVEKRRDEKRRV